MYFKNNVNKIYTKKFDYSLMELYLKNKQALFYFIVDMIQM
jgi:hypothetical protein